MENLKNETKDGEGYTACISHFKNLGKRSITFSELKEVIINISNNLDCDADIDNDIIEYTSKKLKSELGITVIFPPKK